jgi:hypothetical protein
METLEFLAKYGFIDIFFGVGALGIISQLVSRVVPSNLDELHVSADFVVRDSPLFFVQISNAGGRNIYISRAYFKLKARGPFFTKNRHALAPSLRGNFKNITLDFYELRFGDGTREYDCLLKPGYENKMSTGLQLDSMPSTLETGAGLFGKVVIEYATYGKQGKHVIPV